MPRRPAVHASRKGTGSGNGTGRRQIGKLDYQARGVLYLPDEARSRTAGAARGRQHRPGHQRRDAAIEARERGAARRAAQDLQPPGQSHPVSLLKTLNAIPMDLQRRCLRQDLRVLPGQVRHERGAEGRRVLHATSIVKLIVEIIEPFHGRIDDPACGSGGMFVQSARSSSAHKGNTSRDQHLWAGAGGRDGAPVSG